MKAPVHIGDVIIRDCAGNRRFHYCNKDGRSRIKRRKVNDGKRDRRADMTGGREILKEISLFVLDMDGTFYLGTGGWTALWNLFMRWKRQERSFCFSRIILPNPPEDYIRKLEKMDCRISRDQIVTSGM